MGLAMLHHLGNDLDMCTSSIVGTIGSFRKEQCNSSRQWGGDISAQAFFLVLRKPICTTVENHDHELDRYTGQKFIWKFHAIDLVNPSFFVANKFNRQSCEDIKQSLRVGV